MYEIQSVSFKNSVFKAKYIKSGETYQLTSEEDVHPDFEASVKALSDILRRALLVNCERPYSDVCVECKYADFMISRVTAYGIVITKKETEDGDRFSYKLLGSIEIPPTGKNVDIESLQMVYNPEWYEEKTKDGNLLHKPEGCPTYLTDEDMATIENVILETEFFIKGKRCQEQLLYDVPEGGPDMFGDVSEMEPASEVYGSDFEEFSEIF